MAIRTISYLIKHAGKESGPFPLDKVRAMLERREIDETALFRREGTDHWIAACDLDDEAARTEPSPQRLPAVVAAPGGTTLQPVVVKRLDIPFGDIFIVVLKTMIAMLLASPILVVIALLVMLAVSIVGAVLLVGAK